MLLYHIVFVKCVREVALVYVKISTGANISRSIKASNMEIVHCYYALISNLKKTWYSTIILEAHNHIIVLLCGYLFSAVMPNII